MKLKTTGLLAIFALSTLSALSSISSFADYRSLQEIRNLQSQLALLLNDPYSDAAMNGNPKELNYIGVNLEQSLDVLSRNLERLRRERERPIPPPQPVFSCASAIPPYSMMSRAVFYNGRETIFYIDPSFAFKAVSCDNRSSVTETVTAGVYNSGTPLVVAEAAGKVFVFIEVPSRQRGPFIRAFVFAPNMKLSDAEHSTRILSQRQMKPGSMAIQLDPNQPTMAFRIYAKEVQGGAGVYLSNTEIDNASVSPLSDWNYGEAPVPLPPFPFPPRH